ncbi:MAG: N-acetylglucosaminyl transferase component-domain-containing protein [Piptocephalis tieghemiana]|nr:MAG: N-acetylglucosaminyl transferase component-domain-containing protein [Piptocephalis tieghemiana]
MQRLGLRLTGTDREYGLTRRIRQNLLVWGRKVGRGIHSITHHRPVLRKVTRIPAWASLTLLLVPARALAGVILWIIHFTLPILRGASLRSISTTAQQIDIRMRQVCTWPYHFLRIREGHRRGDFLPQEYIRFYNDVWLLANDVIIGLALGAFLIGNHEDMGRLMWGWVDQYTVQNMEEMIVWLKGWPAGLKLNSDLDGFLGDMLLWLLHFWIVCIEPLKYLSSTIILVIGFSGFMGASMVISLVSDLLSALTMHIYWFYIAAARIFHLQLIVQYSLFNLFRGKKRNVLRHRIDSCDYDLDQLLLGTIFFTLLTFLFPTTFVYYLTFAMARVLLLMVHAIAESFLTFLNHFPLFPVMLRLKDPKRLPGRS